MTTIIHNILMPLIDIIEGMGIWGIGLWMLFESSCIPLPSEIILPFGGMMASQGSITLLEANIAAAVGSLIGSMIAYFVGSYGGRPFILKYGKYFFVSEKNFYKAEAVFKKRGMLAVCPGIAKINKFKFIIFSTIGMLPWNFTLIYLGFVFGKDYETKIRPYFKGFENIVIALILICIVLFVIYKIISSRRESNKSMGNK